VQNDFKLKKTSNATKEKIGKDQAWKLIAGMKTVYIGKGKKTVSFEPDENNKEDILKASLGRTGNLRAPSVQVKDTLFIGFNDTIYTPL